MILAGARVLEALGAGPAIPFAGEWRGVAPEAGGPGVYTVWDAAGGFLYVGTAGDLPARLRSHASGRRHGDPFCVHVADRLVLPKLSAAELEAIADGRQSFDALIRAHIRRHLAFRAALVGTAEAARGWEATLRRGAWDHGPPRLNPAEPPRTQREARDPGLV